MRDTLGGFVVVGAVAGGLGLWYVVGQAVKTVLLWRKHRAWNARLREHLNRRSER